MSVRGSEYASSEQQARLNVQADLMAVRESQEKKRMKDIIEAAQEHVEANSFAVESDLGVTERTSRCVDGGYKPDQVGMSYARAGADGGYVEALLKVAQDNNIELSGEDALQIVSDGIESFGRSFQNHTDIHAEHHNHAHHGGSTRIGCGHEQGAIDAPEKYGVDGQAMQQVVDLINEGETPIETDNVVLDREHQEKAVLVVLGEEYSVRPWSEETGDMYFVYDADVDTQVMEALWEHVTSQEGSPFADMSFETFKDAADFQTGATVDRLATSKGKPTLYVRFDDEGHPTVSER